jgi:glycosyltransferase involved in cell wall biosynthesis
LTDGRRVLFYSPGQTEAGGCATHSRLLAEGLAGQGWRVIAVTRAGTLARPGLRRAPNLTVAEVPGFNLRIGALLYLLVASAIALFHGRRATHLAMQLGSQTLVGGSWARIWRRPFVAMSTISGEKSEVKEALQSRWRWLHRSNLRRARWLVGQTAEATAELQAFVPPERTVVIQNPLPEQRHAPLSGMPRALFTGRLSDQKDLPVLLRSWESVVTEIPGATLTLAGDGGEYEPVEEQLRALVASRSILRASVTFTGWVDDVGPYLREADVYAFPSRSEGMSNSLLEACAWRRVVVASDIEPNRAVLGDDYPLLFRTGDSDELARKLVLALIDHDTRRRALAAIDARRAQLNADSAITRLAALLDGGSPPSRR